MKKKPQSYMRVVESGPKEPSAKELERRQAQVLDRLQSLTADQLSEFQSQSVDIGRVGDIGDVAWSKTIWRK